MPIVGFGQNFKEFKTSLDTFYALDSVDLITIPEGLPNGRWKVFFNSDTSRLRYQFNLVDNKVTGCFREYNQYGNLLSIGTYFNDSLWTFRKGSYKNDADTTFKIGNWNKYLWWGPTWDYVETRTTTYKMFFDKDSLFREEWTYSNGKQSREAIYHANKGKISETIFDYSGFIIETFKKTDSYSISTYWTNQTDISSIRFTKDFTYVLDTDTSRTNFYCKDCITQLTSDLEGQTISLVVTDKNGKVRRFVGGGVTLDYDDNGDVKTIQYWNKNRKWKMQTLK
jgi:antitoxin component YwqK of YwqJK toxin-antitoxin module